MMMRMLAVLALIATPGLVTAQSPAVEAALAAADSYNDEEARAILTEACDADDAEACRVLLADLNASFEDEDETAARELATRLCDAGDMLGCATLARYADNGTGGLSSDELKRASLVTACRGGILSACAPAANMAEFGNGGDEDMALAREVAGKGCAGEHAMSCYNVGSYLRNAGWDTSSDAQQLATWQQARRAFQRGCDLGDGASCSALAEMLIEGHGGEADRAGALALQERACGMNYYACENWLRAMKP